MAEQKVHVLHLLHEGEHDAPTNLRLAASVVCAHGAGLPDLSALDEPVQVITVCAPVDHEMSLALDAVGHLDLPVLGIGTGGGPGRHADVSSEISPTDLSVVLHLLCQVRESESSEAPSRAWLDDLTDKITCMVEHLMALRMPNYLARAERVVKCCEWVASRIGMSDREMRVLLQASRLREIGKLGIPDKILFEKRSKRAPAEQAVYERYPLLGAHVLTEMPTLHEVARLLEYQLEHFDGSGPGGLTAHQIPLGSRILRAASAYEMVEIEAEPGVPVDQIIAVLERDQGSLYDPLLLRLVQNYHELEDGETAGVKNTERVRLADLVEGMILAEDIWSRNGIKLIPRGTNLNEHILQVLMSTPLDASLGSVEIYRGSGSPQDEEEE